MKLFAASLYAFALFTPVAAYAVGADVEVLGVGVDAHVGKHAWVREPMSAALARARARIATALLLAATRARSWAPAPALAIAAWKPARMSGRLVRAAALIGMGSARECMLHRLESAQA